MFVEAKILMIGSKERERIYILFYFLILIFNFLFYFILGTLNGFIMTCGSLGKWIRPLIFLTLSSGSFLELTLFLADFLFLN